MLSKMSKFMHTIAFSLISIFSFAGEAPANLNKENFSLYYLALENRDYAALRGFYSDDIRVKFGENILDLDGVIQYEMQQAQFVDISMDIRRIVGDESAIAVEAIQTQTMTRSPPGSTIKIGDQFLIHMIIFYTLQDGKISDLQVFNLSSEQI